MAMKVPSYDRQVEPQPQGISEPKIPMPISGQFGEDVAKATAGLGAAGVEAGTTAITHIQRERYYQEKEAGDNLGVKFARDLVGKVNSTELKTITAEDGSTYDIPDGYLNRQRTQAAGASKEYYQYVEGLKNTYLSQMKNPNVQREFLKNIVTHVDTYGNAIIKHESAQYNEASKDNLDMFITSELQLWPMMDDETRVKSNAGMNGRLDEQYKRGTITYAEMINRQNLIKKTIFTQDISNPIVAEEGLKTNKYNFDIQQMKEARDILDRETTKIQRVNQDEIILSDINKKPMSIEQIQVLANSGKLDPTFAKSKINEIEKGEETITDEKTYEGLLMDISTRKLTATEIYTKVYNNAHRLSKSDRRHLLYVEKGQGITTVIDDYAEEKITQEEESPRKTKRISRPKNNFWDTALNVTKTAVAGTSMPLSYVMGNIIERAQKENAQGEQVIAIANDEVRKQRIRDNPWITTVHKNGKLSEDKYRNKAIIYPDGTFEEVMAGKSGEFIHKESRKKK